MPGLAFRYVGQDRLPTRLSDFDVERYFALTDGDIAALNERSRRDRRAGAAIQLVFLRASGRTLDELSPRALSGDATGCDALAAHGQIVKWVRKGVVMNTR